MSNAYDEEIFWAGVALGQQLKGWSAFGIIDGFDPDGGLIVRPIQQGVPQIKFARDLPFTVVAITDTVNEEETTQVPEPIEITESFSAIVFQRDREFAVVPLSGEVETSEVVMYYLISYTNDPLTYSETYVKTNYLSFSLVTSYTEYSRAEAIDSGSLQALRVDTDRFESITTQGVTEC